MHGTKVALYRPMRLKQAEAIHHSLQRPNSAVLSILHARLTVHLILSWCPNALQIDLSATPAWLWPENMSSWPKQPTCTGSAIIATAFRANRVPDGFVQPDSDAARLMLSKPVSPGRGADDELVQHYEETFRGLQAPTGAPQVVDKCYDYWTPGHRLLQFAEDRPDAVLRWPMQDSLPAPFPASCAAAGSSEPITAECYKSTVSHNLQGDSALNATIPAGRGERRKECGVCGAKVFVYIYNCYQQPGADMLVHVDLRTVQNVAKEDRCYTLRDQVALDLLAVSVFFMAACAVAFLLPMAVSVGWNKVQKLVKQYRQQSVSAEVG
jgi:hypothetical protein